MDIITKSARDRGGVSEGVEFSYSLQKVQKIVSNSAIPSFRFVAKHQADQTFDGIELIK